MATATPSGSPVFLYDGDCAFCTRCARFIERRIPTRATVTPWQVVDLDALGLTVAEADAAVQWIPDSDGPARAAGAPAAGPEAIAQLLVDAGGIWRLLGVALGLRPVVALAWPVYRWVARNRHRMPGGTAACSLPAAQRR